MRIAVDMENVLADPKTWFLETYNERHGTSYRITDVDNWDWVQTEIDFDEFMRTIQDGWRTQAEHFRPLDDDLGDHIERLADRTGGTVDIVTARTGVEIEMQRWLDRHDVTTYDEFISISPFETKADLDYDIYIDDNPRLADNLTETQTQYLVTWPWNRSARDHPRTIPVERISEAVSHLCERTPTVDF